MKLNTLKLSALWLLAIFAQFALYADDIAIQSSYRITSNWGSGYIATVDIKNSSNQALTAWQSSFTIPDGQVLDSLWNGQFIRTGQTVTVKNETWNADLQPGQSISIGVQISNPQQTEPKLNQLSAKGTVNSGGTPTPSPSGGLPVQLVAQFKVDSDWGSGKQLSITITNGTSSTVNQWLVEFDLAQGQSLSSLWGGQYSVQQKHVKVTNPSWSGGGLIAPGSSVTIGLIVNSTQATSTPIINLIVTGNPSSTPVQLPQAPILNPVNNDDRDENYLISWQAVPNATRYTLEYSLNSNFSNSSIVLNENVLQTQIQGQTNGTHYYRVYASNDGGNGPYSNVQSVLVQLSQPTGTPTLQSIVNADLDGNYQVSWTAVDNATGYILEESTDSSFTTAQTVYNGVDTNKNFIAKQNGTFFYRVKAYNSSETGSASNVQAVTVMVTTQPMQRKIIGYYTNWAIYRNPSFKPQDINVNLVTHINYAFAQVDTSGNILLFDSWADIDYRSDWNTEKPYWGNFRQLYDLKQAHPQLKTLISIGGWTLSDTFSAMAASPTARANFAQKCVEFCKKYNFDGVDLDWEYPGFAEHNGRPEDKHNFTLLLQTVSAALKAQNPPLLLTIAAPAGPNHYNNMEVDLIHPYLDWINLMCYDFHGPWGGEEDAVTNHLSALMPSQVGNNQFNVAATVNFYLSKGVPSQKLVLGIPLYGRSYANANSTPTGLFSTYSGPGRGTTEEAGFVFFSDIKKNLLSTYQYYWDSQASAAYLYHPTSKEFISFDSEEALALKGQYIKSLNLGGAMIWELGTDTRPAWQGMTTIFNSLKD